MSFGRAYAIALRVIRQFLRDHRTMALMVVAPVVVMTLVGLSIPEDPQFGSILDLAAPAILAAFAFVFVFILTGVSFLRERASGTFERLMASPVSRLEIVLGYLAGLFLFSAAQAIIILFFTIYALDVHYRGALWEIFLFQMLVTVGAVNLGIFISTFSRNELQVVQFIPLVITPQFLLSGILWPVEQMPWYLQRLSQVLPLTYAVDGLGEIMRKGRGLTDVWLDLLVLGGFAALMALLAAQTIRRRAS